MKISLKYQLISFLLISIPAFSQSRGLPRKIPLEMETFLYHDTYIKITYSVISLADSQSKKFIEENQLWELGTNEPAELMTTGDLLAGKDTLKAGAYSLFAIPGEKEWIIIFNKDVGLFGTYRYIEKRDAFRLTVPVKTSNEYIDRLVIYFEEKGIPESVLSIGWLDKKVSVPIKIIENEHN